MGSKGQGDVDGGEDVSGEEASLGRQEAEREVLKTADLFQTEGLLKHCLTRRIASLPKSNTSRFPSASSARSAGWLKRAASAPYPSANPASPLPASVRTAPPDVTT